MFGFLTELSLRANNAIMALAIIMVVQAAIIVCGIIFKKQMLAMPVMEHALRPLIMTLSDKLNRKDRADFALIIRGTIVFFCVMALMSMVGIAIENILVLLGYGTWIDVVLLCLVLSPLAILRPALSISTDKPINGAYQIIARSLNQNLIPADKYGLRRASIAAILLSFVEWVCAPILFYMVGGIPLCYFYVSLSLFIRVSGYDNGAFVSVFGMMYRLLSLIVNGLTSMIIILSSAFTTGGNPYQAIKGRLFSAEGAIAYSQNITIGGAVQNRYGEAVSRPWIGPKKSTAKVTHKDVLRVVIHYGIALFFVMIILMACFMVFSV